MESIRRKLPRAYLRCGLMLLGLTCWLGTADARSKLLPSEQFPGPWAEVTQEIRDVLALNKVFGCSQAMAQDEKLWTSWRVQTAGHGVRGPGKLFEDIALPDNY